MACAGSSPHMTSRSRSNVVRLRPLLGTFVRVSAAGAGRRVLEDGVARAFAAVSRVGRLMSFRDPESELSRLNAQAHSSPMAVSPETFAVLRLARRLARLSGGRFDPAVAPHLVRRGFLPGTAPASSARSARDLRLLKGRHVAFRRPMQLDLGGIAKGYAVDRAVRALRRSGVPRGAVEAGGDLLVFGPAVETVWLRDPHQPSRLLALLQLRDAAVATSAYELAARDRPGHAMSPIIDPRRGTPRRGLSSVTVAAPSCALADGLTKIVTLAGRGARPVLGALGASAVIVAPGGRITRLEGTRGS
jgi:thiamine biosynthesis lipoprotein